MQLPERKNLVDMTPADAKELLSVLPNVASYVAACVAEGGVGSTVRIQIVGIKDTKKWGMDVAIPGHLLQEIEHIDGPGIPTPKTVLENLTPQVPVPDGEIIAKVDVRQPQKAEEADVDLTAMSEEARDALLTDMDKH